MLEADKDGYLVRDIDLNNDGLNDKVVSSNPYQGDRLYFFIRGEDGLQLALSSINFSEDGGYIINDIYPSEAGNEVAIIHTYFPDRGNLQAFHHIALDSAGDWVLSETQYETTVAQGSATYVCRFMQNIPMNDFVSADGFEYFNHLPIDVEGSEHCSLK